MESSEVTPEQDIQQWANVPYGGTETSPEDVPVEVVIDEDSIWYRMPA
jgi:hypothetical protein